MDIGVQIEFLVTPQLSVPSSPRYGEWPPAPDRVFQALVATAAETNLDMGVLRYLESAPAIQATEALTPSAPKRYVPDNYKRSKRYHQGAARFLPTVHPESLIVTYVWKDIPLSVVETLRTIVENISHVGRASSLARGRLLTQKTYNIDWLPDENGKLLLRTPYPGRLEHLCVAYDAGLRSSMAPSSGYKRVGEVFPTTGWKELMVLRPERQLAVSETTVWTARMRRAIMSKAPDDMPALIHGHNAHRHVAWTAIPDVGHRHASGGIIGIGCWLPGDITLSEKALLGSLFMQLEEVDGIRLRMDSKGLKGLQPGTWSNPSTTWATVTPIALDRWPKRKKGPEDIIVDSLRTMKLPEPIRVLCDNQSPIQKAANARKYPSRKANRYITHAVIEWSAPIVGPLLIGADRYFGSGLCWPLRGGG